MINLKNKTILKLQKDILVRYEHNLQDGIMILYNVKNETIWMGNSASRDLIKLIDGKRTLEEIYEILLPEYAEYDLNEVVESFNNIIEELVEKKFLELIGN